MEHLESGHKERFEGCGALSNILLFGVVVATIVDDLGNIANKLQVGIVCLSSILVSMKRKFMGSLRFSSSQESFFYRLAERPRTLVV